LSAHNHKFLKAVTFLCFNVANLAALGGAFYA